MWKEHVVMGGTCHVMIISFLGGGGRYRLVMVKTKETFIMLLELFLCGRSLSCGRGLLCGRSMSCRRSLLICARCMFVLEREVCLMHFLMGRIFQILVS